MPRSFAIFSNRIGEYEIFIKTRIVYWPRSIGKPTPSQSKNQTKNEAVGDTVYLVSGASIRDNCVKNLKNNITSSPMITHKGKVVEIKQNPVICYCYTHGSAKSKKNDVMLPFEMFEVLKTFDTFLDEAFTSENLEEINRILQVGSIIQTLLQEEKIKFERAYQIGDKFYIRDETNGLFILDEHFTPISEADANVGRIKKVQMMPNKSSLLAIRNACTEAGLNGSEVILKLGTWQGKQYTKVKLSEDLFLSIDWDKGLPQGISTRLLSDESGDPLVSKLYNAVTNGLESISTQKENKAMDLAKNQILYGPPGTGKTYSVVRKALEIVNPQLCKQLIIENANRESWMKAYKQYTENKQIQFCTFHQSYSYEDFVEGLRSDSAGNFIPTNGVFLDICKEALESNQIITPTYEFDEEQTNFYKMSLGRKDIDDDIYNYCIENNVISIGFGGELDFSDCDTYKEIKELIEESYKGKDKKETVLQALSYFKNSLEIDDIILVSKGNSHIRAIGRVVGQYKYDKNTDIRFNHFRKVQWLYKEASIPVEEVLIGRKFMMRSIYKLDKDNLNLEALQKHISTVETPTNLETKNYVLIMDEINRGNISRIFGELITLIEEDKRLGEANEVIVKLPYSRKAFGVPTNLYVIGTMNTADRSITLIDTALRRRFEFIEMLPDISLLPEDVDGINVKILVQTINQRIEYLYDRDHTIGHAFFLVEDLSEQKIINIIQKKIIPLLQEYFYDDWEKIELVLGGAAINSDSSYFIKKEAIKPANIFIETNSDFLEERITYSIVTKPTKEALFNVYKGKDS
ncbi:AAA family ATPase [Priestia megaterium]|uniref:AAA family ATPase n=1 Tax=Priestia megaterium TaxID=1404 RepID=UPI00300955FC